MADPFGSNITTDEAKQAELSDPNLFRTKMPQRVVQLRTDMDGLVAGVTEATVRTVLSSAAGTVALNNQTITAVGTVDGVDISTSNAVLAIGAAVDVSAGNVSKSYTADGQVYTDVTGHATNELTITSPVVGGLLVINETAGAVVKLKIAGGGATTLTASKTSVLVILTATTAAVISEK